MSILIAVLLFSFLIFVHELGHFSTAKLLGVQVKEFSLFMGPAIWKKQIGETQYTLRCIPIGGYCAMEGEDIDTESPRSFQKAAWWKRLIILAAGAAMNFLFGLILLAVVYAPAKEIAVPVIDFFEEGCALNGADGLMADDEIYSIDGERVYTSSDFSLILSLNPGQQHDLVVKRGNEKVRLNDFSMVKREFTEEDGTVSLRYGFSFSVVPATLWEKTRFIWNTAMSNVQLVKLSLKMLLTGQAGFKDMGGPVMIVDQMSQVAQQSETAYDAFMNLIYFGAFLAINLAVMNLLPIPALDGGRIACLLITTVIEAITRKKLNPRYEAYIHSVGMILLLILMGLIMFKDIFTIIKR